MSEMSPRSDWAGAPPKCIPPLSHPQARHGAKRYTKGCPCDICRAAHAAKVARYRARKRESVAA